MGRRHEAEHEDEGLLVRIERACGLEAAQKLFAAVGGTEVYLGPSPRPGTPVYDAIGPEAANRLWNEIGTGRVLIPVGRARGIERIRKEARELDAAGLSRPRIARTLGVHIRSVYRWLQEDAE